MKKKTINVFRLVCHRFESKLDDKYVHNEPLCIENLKQLYMKTK